MAFGLTQWLISFTIFLIVLTIITWSAIHLGRKEKNLTASAVTDVVLDVDSRLLDVNEYSTGWKNKLLLSTIVPDLTLRVIESTTGPTLFANEPGSEIADSVQLYKILQNFSSIEDHPVNSTTITTIFAPSYVRNNSMWKDDTAAITLYNTSDKITSVSDDRDVSGKVTILPDHISRTTSANSLDVAKLRWKSDLSQSAGTELSEFLQDGENGTSDTFVTISSAPESSNAKQSNTTEQIKI